MAEDDETVSRLDRVERDVQIGQEVDEMLLRKLNRVEKRQKHHESWMDFWILYILFILVVIMFGDEIGQTLQNIGSMVS